MMLLAVLLLPLLTALLLLAVKHPGQQRALAVGGAGLTLLLALFLPVQASIEVLWLPGVNAYFALAASGARGFLVLVAALVMLPTLLYASSQIQERRGAFLALLLLMQAGLNGVFLATDLLLYYLFWEATLIPSLLLLGRWGGEKRREAVMKYLVYAVTGSFVMLVSILALRPLSGAMSYRLEDLLAVTPLLSASTQNWLFAGFALAFAVKLPIVPLHAWLIDFHEQNHPCGAADVAGTLYKVGGWGFFAWALPLLPAAAAQFTPWLLALAAFTALYGAILATAQNHLKRLLAYASLSHMGVLGVGIFGLHLLGLNGAMYLLAAQMLSTGGLFLLSGMLYERRQSFALEHYGGLAKSAPALAALTLFVLFASIGVPGLSNFPGEFMSLMGAFQRSPWLGTLATSAVIAAAVYGVNMYQRLYQGSAAQGDVKDVQRLELLVLLPLLVGILWLGIWPQQHLARIEQQSVVLVRQLHLQQALAAGATLPQLRLSDTQGEQ